MSQRENDKQEWHRTRWKARRKEDWHILVREYGSQASLQGKDPLPHSILLTLTYFAESENFIGKATLHKHCGCFTSIGSLPSRAAGHIPLLPWPISFRYWPLLLCTAMPPVCIRSMPQPMHQAASNDSHLPCLGKFNSWPPPFPGIRWSPGIRHPRQVPTNRQRNSKGKHACIQKSIGT